MSVRVPNADWIKADRQGLTIGTETESRTEATLSLQGALGLHELVLLLVVLQEDGWW
jgi:hypothetical protein